MNAMVTEKPSSHQRALKFNLSLATEIETAGAKSMPIRILGLLHWVQYCAHVMVPFLALEGKGDHNMGVQCNTCWLPSKTVRYTHALMIRLPGCVIQLVVRFPHKLP